MTAVTSAADSGGGTSTPTPTTRAARTGASVRASALLGAGQEQAAAHGREQRTHRLRVRLALVVQARHEQRAAGHRAAADQKVVPSRYGASTIASKRSPSVVRNRCIGADHTDAASDDTCDR